MDTLYIVMPAYNEEENIQNVVNAWYPIIEEKNSLSRLVIADSGSSDSTHPLLLDMQKRYPKLEVLSETGKQHGPKVIALYDYAIQQGADYIFQTDSDGQTDPAEFPAFWEQREQYDGIFGDRTAREDGAMRACVEKVVCFLLRIYFGVKVPDANAPFRLLRASSVQKYLYTMSADYNLPNIMMTTFFVHYQERTQFCPITFRPRQGGVNSINIPKIVKIGWKALGDFRMFKKEMNKHRGRKTVGKI